MNPSDKEAGLAATYPDGTMHDERAYPAGNTFPEAHKDTMSDSETVVSDSHLKPMGVLKVEAAEAYWNPKTKWILFIS
jgi:hypothetical protein